MNIIVTGGGTGGHIFPALAIADHFKAKIPKANITYVGAKNGLETTIVPRHGYKFQTLDIKGIQRKITLKNIKNGFKAANSLVKCNSILKKNHIDLVVGTGGYVSGPITYVAQMRGIKTAIHEQNVFPGVTNKILAKRANNIFCGFKEAIPRFNNEKAIYSGIPVNINQDIYSKKEARKTLNISTKEKLVLIMGGSGGSQKINDVVTKMLPKLMETDVSLIHSTGEDYYDQFIGSLTIDINDRIKFYPFIYDVYKYIAACDVAVCSAGASTIAELNFFNKPKILIPKSHTSENHQEFNAKAVEANEAGICILEKDLNEKVLIESIEKIINDKKLMKNMEESSKKMYKSDSLDIIYERIMKDFEK